MGDPNLEPLRVETILKLLDQIVHDSTLPTIREGSLRAYQKLSHGMSPTALFGEDCEILLIEQEYEEKYAEQLLEINRLNAEIRRLNKALNGTKRRQRAHQGNDPVRPDNGYDGSDGMASEGESLERPEMIITDAEWELIQDIVPRRYLNIDGRERIATLIVILGIGAGRIKHPWRVLRTPDKPEGWTTFYNQHVAWQKKDWWKEVVSRIGHDTKAAAA